MKFRQQGCQFCIIFCQPCLVMSPCALWIIMYGYFLLCMGTLIISFKYYDLLFLFYFLVRWGKNTAKETKESKLT
jgi:hypothetical protein